ncbi:hypothetical protein PspLS_01557 [Pyricularia sp. CBS 133598]|nr:hypothetical protein PspLS_01557 [Pyricularia sp. CBS 133598]
MRIANFFFTLFLFASTIEAKQPTGKAPTTVGGSKGAKGPARPALLAPKPPTGAKSKVLKGAGKPVRKPVTGNKGKVKGKGKSVAPVRGNPRIAQNTSKAKDRRLGGLTAAAGTCMGDCGGQNDPPCDEGLGCVCDPIGFFCRN